MKRILTFFFALFAFVGTWAQANSPKSPEFSTEGAEKWYSVEFKNGKACLRDKGAGQNLRTSGVSYADPSSLWMLEGTASNFVMKSKAGNYVKFESDRYKAVADKKNASSLKLYNKSGNDSWEIQLLNVSDKSMNQNGGAGAGRDLANWDAGDGGNQLYFVEPVAVTNLPEMSTEGNIVWYTLIFKAGSNAMADQGEGATLRTAVANSNVKDQLWQFVGTPSNFKLKSANGRYISKPGGDFATTSNASQAVSFRFLAKANDGFFELQRINEDGKCMNQNGGTSVGAKLSEWAAGDGNNPMTFKEVTESGLPTFSNTESPVYHNVVFNGAANCYLGDVAANEMLVVADANNNRIDDEQLWVFDGNKENFKLLSKKGNYVAWDAEAKQYKSVAEAAQAATFHLVNMSKDFTWEIQRVGAEGTSMNVAEVAVGQHVGEAAMGHANSALNFAVLNVNKLPVFSAANDPFWYAVEFNSSNKCIAGKLNQGKAVTANWNMYDEGLYWSLVGTQGNFIMKNYLGDYLFFNGKVCETTTDVAQATAFKLAMNADQSLEIRLASDISQALNQLNGSTNAGTKIGVYDSGDQHNKLHFVFKQIPDFLFTLAGGQEHWWMVNFNANKANLTSHGLGKNVTNEKLDKTLDTQLWKLVGDNGKFQLINKLQQYATIDAKTDLLVVSDKPDANGFALDEGQIKYLGKGRGGDVNKVYLNMDGGAVLGYKIGMWTKNDGNNKLTFLDPVNFVMPFEVKGIDAYSPASPYTLWYKQPATSLDCGNNWMEYSLPLGNGQLGASIFGGIAKDEILFNEKTVWTGSTSSYGHYQYFGSIFAEDKSGATGFKNYVRQLDLTNATASVAYTDAEGVNYSREYFVSHPNNVIVARYKADAAGKLTLRFTMKSGRPGVYANTVYENGTAFFRGKLETVSYRAHMQVINKGGELQTTDDYIDVTGADEIMVVMSGGTDYDPSQKSYVSGTGKLQGKIEGFVEKAASLLAEEGGWNTLYQAHLDDYQPRFGNCMLSIDGAVNAIPTNEMVDKYAKISNKDNAMCKMLEQLYFSYGRYLEIASSRGVDLPSNLQGIWNNNSSPAWHGDIHANINVQMNYWPAEITNMSEMHLPFLNYIITMAESDNWKANARESGQTKGWTCYTENNIFGSNGGFAKNYVIANAWYCSHLWQHYRYTLDEDFLKRAFPAMWSATEYWMERIKYNAEDGTYECPNEYSPEHGPSQNAVAHAQQIVWELFDNTKTAIDILGADALGLKAADVEMLNDRLQKLDKGLRTETYKGGVNGWPATRNGIKEGDILLREWKYSPFSVSNDQGHRHMSHLMCVYPFNQVTKDDATLLQAATNSMILRGDISTGWSMGWKVNLWARLLNGDRAHTIISNALRHSTAYGTNAGAGGVYYNLFDSHSPFQIDGNFGTCSGIAEMLIQSHRNIIDILPALPKVWKNGNIHGLKAIGNFTVDIEWQDGQATSATVVSHKGTAMRVSYPAIAKAKVMVDGAAVEVKVIDDNTIEIPAKINQTATILFADITGIEGGVAVEEEAPVSIYNLAGVRMNGELNQMPKGVYIVNGKKVIVK